MRFCTIFLFFLYTSIANGQNWAWAYPLKTKGSSAIRATETDTHGHPYFLGSVQDSIYFHAGNGTFASGKDIQCFVTKYDPAGNLSWVSGASGAQGLVVRDMAVDSQHSCFITGSFLDTTTFGKGNDTLVRTSAANNYDYFFVKLDSAGKTKRFETDGQNCMDEGISLISLSSDELITSWYDEKVCNSSIDSNYIQKRDINGNLLWNLPVPTSTYALTYARGLLTSTRDNGFLVAHYWNSQSPLCFTGFKDTICVSPNIPDHSTDAFLAKYSASGDVKWVKTFRGPNSQYIRNITTDASNNVLVLGGGYDTSQYEGVNLLPLSFRTDYLIKTDSAGNYLNSLSFPIDTFKKAWRGYWINQLETDRFDNIYVGGTLNSTLEIGGHVVDLNLTTGQHAYIIVKLDKNLKYVWSQFFSTQVFYATFNCCLAVSDDYVFVGANHNASVYFNDFPASFNVPVTNQSFSFVAAIHNGTSTVGVREEDLSTRMEMSVFPNPGNGLVTIKSALPHDVRIMVKNILGEMIYIRDFANTSEMLIDLRGQPAGVYCVESEIANLKCVKKIVIQ